MCIYQKKKTNKKTGKGKKDSDCHPKQLYTELATTKTNVKIYSLLENKIIQAKALQKKPPFSRYTGGTRTSLLLVFHTNTSFQNKYGFKAAGL